LYIQLQTSFITAFSKIFEKFICKRLSDFLNSNSTRAGEQFGFKNNLLMVVALFCFTHELLGALNNKIHVRGMSCVFALDV
jgi:hypothetical protein